jgi:putative membrane protein
MEMSMSRYLTPLVFVGTLLAAANVAGQGNAPQNGQAVLDSEFVIVAFNGQYAVIKYSELADTRAANDKVKAFARKLFKEHKSMMDGLNPYIAKQKLTPVSGAQKASQTEAERLSKLQGAAFDHAFLKRTIEDHEKALEFYEAESKLGKNADLKAYASGMLPRLRDHLQEAKILASQLKQ